MSKNSRTKLQLDNLHSQDSTSSLIPSDFIHSSHSKGWISHRAFQPKEDPHKLAVTKYSRIKSNSTLKLVDKNIKTSKAFGPKSSCQTTKNSTRNYQAKRNKSYDYFKKGTRKSSKDYKRVKEYVQSKGVQRSNKENISTRKQEMIDKMMLSSSSPPRCSPKEDSKVMKRKPLSIEIPSEEPQNAPEFTLPKDLGPHRSISVQNRTTTITQFSSLSPSKEDPLLGILPKKVEVNIPLKSGKDIVVPNFEPTKTSVKRNGVVSAYAANTHQGIVRGYNEDRVSIILNIVKPPSRKDEIWPKWSFFGIYDGHGGSKWAEFLRDYLHQFVIRDSSFPTRPKEAIRNGFRKAESKFLEACHDGDEILDKSGSWAIVVLVVGSQCFVANVGDSRALLSSNNGTKIYSLSRDHKPSDEAEKKRIITSGGQIYHRTAITPTNNGADPEVVVGPLRVLPGRLSVCRTFGDIEAKLSRFSGNPNVIIATPEIKTFEITSHHDFIVMGCDGIFDKLNNQDTIKWVWNSVEDSLNNNTVHVQWALGVEYIIKNSLLKKTLDNVTVVIIAFEGFEKYLNLSNEVVDYRPTAHSVSPKRERDPIKSNHGRQFSTEYENVPPSQRATPKKSYENKISSYRNHN
jgi:serine/threonine protein phosphatase PrpC